MDFLNNSWIRQHPISRYRDPPKSFKKMKGIGRGEQEKEFFFFLIEEWIISDKVTFLLGMEMVFWADDLTSADQVIPYWLAISHIPRRDWSCK